MQNGEQQLWLGHGEGVEQCFRAGCKTWRNPAPSDHYSRVLWHLQMPPRGAGRMERKWDGVGVGLGWVGWGWGGVAKRQLQNA